MAVGPVLETRPPRGRRWLPLACGLTTFALVILVWGSLAKLPVGDDEAAYVLQAKIFAAGQFTAAARPLPEFFRQHHVFTTPVLAAKYPPGHSLLLTPGIWFALPGLAPALLVGLTAALLCDVTRRLTNDATALLAVLIAVTSHISLRFDPSYFSEVSTSFEIVLCWWALYHYWRAPRRGWLILVAVAIAWCAITRPFTALAFAIPTGIATLVVLRRHRTWRHVAPAAIAAVIVFAILPLYNARVTGDWRRLTQSEYARLYLPSDRLGFGLSGEAPAAHLSVDELVAERRVAAMHAEYSNATFGAAAEARAANLIAGTWSYHGLPGLAILLAVIALPVGVSRLVLGTALAVFVAYLAYAHDPTWTLYYLELQAPLAFLTAVGFGRLAEYAGARLGSPSSRSAIRAGTFAAIGILLLVPAVRRVASYRRAHAEQRGYREQLERAVASLPAGPAIVFIPYDTTRGEARLMQNVPDLSKAPVWIAHDCGADDSRLLALAPARTAYIYRIEAETGDGRIQPYTPPPSGEPGPGSASSC